MAVHALQALRGHSLSRQHLSGPYDVSIRLYLPDRRRRDADNVAKAIADALNGVVWQDDSEITRFVIEKHIDPANPRTEIDIEGAQPNRE